MNAEVDAISNRERRLRDSVQDLPEPWATTRERGESEAASRHLSALRFRLDRLVHVENAYGEDQKGLHRNRAERNAILWALRGYADVKIQPEARPAKRHDQSYVNESLVECGNLVADGFTEIDARRPGTLLHKSGPDIAPIRVTLVVWFFMAGRLGITRTDTS